MILPTTSTSKRVTSMNCNPLSCIKHCIDADVVDEAVQSTADNVDESKQQSREEDREIELN